MLPILYLKNKGIKRLNLPPDANLGYLFKIWLIALSRNTEKVLDEAEVLLASIMSDRARP